MFDQKGQGSLEYLLMIGGAVLVAAIVIGLVVTSAGDAGSNITSTTEYTSFCASFSDHTSCTSNLAVTKLGSTANPNLVCQAVTAGGAAVPSTGVGFDRCVAK